MPVRKPRKEPDVGTICTHSYKGKTYTMTVVKVEGRIGFKVGRDVFNSPTAAATSITKNSINGWAFWAQEEEPTEPRRVTIHRHKVEYSPRRKPVTFGPGSNS